MKKAIKRMLAITLASAVAFTFIPAFSGCLDAHAASTPARVTKLNLKATGQTTARVSWNRIKKGLNGYTVYRNGKAVRHIGKNVTSFNDGGLKPGTSYSYYVRAYKNTKQKQWFNKKTKKWQKKKPASKIRGKSRKVTVKVYGKASPTLRCITAAASNSESTTISRYIRNISFSADNNKVVMKWEANADAIGTVIYRDGVVLARLDKSARSYTDTTVDWPEGIQTKHEYIIEVLQSGEKSVKGYVNITRSGNSDAVSSHDTPQIELNWDKVDGAVSYTINRTKKIDNVIAEEKKFSCNEERYTDTEVEPYVRYSYSVIAKLSDGQEVYARNLSIVK